MNIPERDGEANLFPLTVHFREASDKERVEMVFGMSNEESSGAGLLCLREDSRAIYKRRACGVDFKDAFAEFKAAKKENRVADLTKLQPQ